MKTLWGGRPPEEDLQRGGASDERFCGHQPPDYKSGLRPWNIEVRDLTDRWFMCKEPGCFEMWGSKGDILGNLIFVPHSLRDTGLRKLKDKVLYAVAAAAAKYELWCGLGSYKLMCMYTIKLMCFVWVGGVKLSWRSNNDRNL